MVQDAVDGKTSNKERQETVSKTLKVTTVRDGNNILRIENNLN